MTASSENRAEAFRRNVDLEELLVAQRDVFGRQCRVGAAQQVLAVETLLGLDGGGVDAQQPVAVVRR
jgi:hypothetical protein